MGKTNFFLRTLPFSPWAVSATWLHVVAPQENTRKMNLTHVLNNTLPWAHTESKLDVLGVPKKLVKYIIHLSKRKN
jgi:hypothetical protein